jgi:hypothetical protein
MLPDDDNPELTKFMVAYRFAGHVDFATMPEARQERARHMIQDLTAAFSAAIELMCMSKADMIERQGWNKPIMAETLAIACKTAEAVTNVLKSANARQMCAMAEFADLPQASH